jgi:hypothetical protein
MAFVQEKSKFFTWVALHKNDTLMRQFCSSETCGPASDCCFTFTPVFLNWVNQRQNDFAQLGLSISDVRRKLHSSVTIGELGKPDGSLGFLVNSRRCTYCFSYSFIHYEICVRIRVPCSLGMERKLNMSQHTPRACLKVNRMLIFKGRNLFFPWWYISKNCYKCVCWKTRSLAGVLMPCGKSYRV